MLQFEDSYILIAAAMILSLLFALFIYYKDPRFKESHFLSRVFLIGFRFISLACIVLFLFNPKWIKAIKKVEKPIVVVLQDASSSILNYEDSLYYKTEFIRLLEQNNQELSKDFEVFTYHFSDSLYDGLDDNYIGEITDISKALQTIEDLFYNRNLAAIIVASDGVYTKGTEPNYTIHQLNTPVFTLALGDSTVQKDIAIESVHYNEIAYLENIFPIEFELHSNYNTRNKKRVQIINKGKVVHEEWINLQANLPIKKQVLIEADEEGIQYYQINISTFESEKNTQNNSFKIALEVVNNSQNILILAAAPHPDIAALKSSLEVGKNYKVKTSLFHEYKEDIEAYNLIILHQIPQYSTRNAKLLKTIKESNTSLLFITGKRTKWTTFNEIQDLVTIKTNNSSEEVFPILNENFAPFDLSKNAISFIQSAPPLLSTFGEFTKNDYSHWLFKQSIRGINTSNELLVFTEKEDKLIAVLLAEGLWKWRLYDYQKNKTHDNFNEILQATSQYLTLNKDKRKLRLNYPKLSIQGNPFKLNAQLYNDNYQLIEEAELNLQLYDEEGKEYHYTLSNKGTNYYSTLNNLSEGNYSFTLSSSYKEEDLVRKGTFAILAATVEQQKLEANWDLLQKMSSTTKGAFIVKEQFFIYAEKVKEKISKEPELYYIKQLSDLIKQKAIFLVLLLSLFFEWALRKRLGTH